jgi:hypothetical protein
VDGNGQTSNVTRGQLRIRRTTARRWRHWPWELFQRNTRLCYRSCQLLHGRPTLGSAMRGDKRYAEVHRGQGIADQSNNFWMVPSSCSGSMIPVPPALADRVFWGCSYGEPQILRSGPIASRQEVRQCKNMILSCSRGAESLFTASDFADYIAASADGRYIVGLSNRGSENAFWIRDSHGKVIERRTHTFGLRHW